MDKATYLHMRYKNNAIACFARTEKQVKHIEAQEQLDRHRDSAEIWLYRGDIKDWHRYEPVEGRDRGNWVCYAESDVPATVVQYVKLTAE